MQELFANWLALDKMQQILFTYTVSQILNRHEITIFAGVLKGMQFWNAVQDLEGELCKTSYGVVRCFCLSIKPKLH